MFKASWTVQPSKALGAWFSWKVLEKLLFHHVAILSLWDAMTSGCLCLFASRQKSCHLWTTWNSQALLSQQQVMELILVLHLSELPQTHRQRQLMMLQHCTEPDWNENDFTNQVEDTKERKQAERNRANEEEWRSFESQHLPGEEREKEIRASSIREHFSFNRYSTVIL